MDQQAKSDRPPRRPVARPRDAASMIVLREAAGRTEVLLGMRSAGHRFMPNRLAFPGGAVERSDFAATAASLLTPQTETMLDKAARPGLAHALGIAAGRELSEETGLSLGQPPRLDGLAYLCRAVTPPSLPIRFHARFFVVAAERLEGSLGGSGELADLHFYQLDNPVFAALPWITAQVLAELAAWLRLPPLKRTGLRRTAVYRDRARREE